MRPVLRYFASRSILANLITFSIAGIGIFTLSSINRTQFPNVDLGEMFITTPYPGASAEDVELNVTNKIEKQLKGVVGIKRYTSRSEENLSFIHVVLDGDVDDGDAVKDDIREAVNRIPDFPEELVDRPRIKEIKTSIFPILEIGLYGDLSYPKLREYAKLFEKKLENIKGVARLDRYGYRDREIVIEVNPEKIKKFHIPMDEIFNAIKNRNVRASGGTLESFISEKNVVTLSQFRDPMDVKDVIVRSTTTGHTLKVSDLAEVKDTFEEERIFSRINGKKSISFVVIKSEDADIISTIDRIQELIAEEKSPVSPFQAISNQTLDFEHFPYFEIIKNHQIRNFENPKN